MYVNETFYKPFRRAKKKKTISRDLLSSVIFSNKNHNKNVKLYIISDNLSRIKSSFL